MKKKIVLIVAHQGYQQDEYQQPRAILEKKGAVVITVSDEPGLATAKDGSTTSVDMTIDELSSSDYDALFVIGGPGALDCLDNVPMHELLRNVAATDKPFGAICISARIVARAGVLEGKRATGWDGDGELADVFKKHNVIYVKQPVVVDEKIITAVGPQAAHAFGEAIAAALKL